MNWWQGVAATIVAASVLATLAWLSRPWLNRLERKRMVSTGDHGVVCRVYTRPSDMQNLDPKQMLGLEPFWLTDSDFYFEHGIPGNGPADEAAWQEWAEQNGGEGAGWRHVLIRVQSTQDRAVLLLNPKVNVERFDVGKGVILGPERQAGGNGLMCRQFNLELDDPAPTARYSPGLEAESDRSAQFPMSKGSSEAFLVIAHATAGRYEWTVTIECIVDGQTINLSVDDGGRPFVTVGLENVARLWWHFEQATWEPAGW